MKSNVPPTIGAIIGSFAAIVGINAMSNAVSPLALMLNEPLHRMGAITSLYLVAQIAALPTLSLWLKKTSPINVSLYASLVFFFASLLCATASTFESILFARIIQGLAGGISIAVVPVIIKRYHPPERQANILTGFSLIGATAPIVGPVFVSFLSAETIYLMFILCATLSLISVTLLTFPSAVLHDIDEHNYRKPDLIALLSLSLGIGLLVFVIDNGKDYGWFHSAIVRTGFYVGALLFLFGAVHQTKSQSALLPIRLLFTSTVGSIIISGALMGAAIYGFMYLVPYYLVQAHHASPNEVLKVVLFTSIPQIILLPLFPFIRRSIPTSVILASGGLCIVISVLMLTHVNQNFSGEAFLYPQVLRAVGIPFCVMSLTFLLVSKTSSASIGGASTLYATMRSLGGAISISAATAYTTYRHDYYVQSQFHPEATWSTVSQQAWHYAFSDMFMWLFIFFTLYISVAALLMTLKFFTVHNK